jgi:thioredoxin 1
MTAHRFIEYPSLPMILVLFVLSVWLSCCKFILADQTIIHHRRIFLHRPSSSLTPSSTYSSKTATNLLFNIRGGDIQPITSLSQVKGIIQNASDTNQLVVLDFTANNCPPCDMIAPIYSELSELEEFESKVIFLKVNVSEHPDVASYYGVDGWPTFHLFQNGHFVDSIVGGQAAKAGLYSLVARYSHGM